MMTIDEIRERFLEFFKKRGHTVCPSDSLIPSNDPSLLFTGAGMNQFKDMFLGRGSLGFKRAASSQKCLRTGDVDRVGRTSGHHTFFEMLGNFSFGDYFKRDAINWAWEFACREMGIPAEHLFVSVYQDDEEAYGIWHREIGLAENKIFKLGEADNFWPAGAPSQGPNGPCGPCSEIYYDFGAKYGCGSPTCDITCKCNRYVEIWNLVFTQFDRQEDGSLPPLPQQNIDTGAGLERWGAVLQGVHSNFDTDVFKTLIAAEGDILGRSYAAATEDGSRMRRIADHVRALAFCIADNAMPGNTGRNYVVRRILRTAVRDGVNLGRKEPFLHLMIPAVLAVMKKAYPYLLERQKTIEQVIKTEEEKFLDTLEKGNALIDEAVDRLRKVGQDTLSGEEAFKLYDTFGFPIEMTEAILRDHRIKVDRVRFERLLDGKGKSEMFTSDIFGSGALGKIKEEKVSPTEFLGYGIPVTDLAKPVEATVLRIIHLKGRKEYEASKKDLAAFTKMLSASTLAESSGAGTEIGILLDRTPLYAEGGGQVGDTGTISGDGVEIAIEDCKKPDGYFIHLGKVGKGTLRVGTKVRIAIDVRRRLDIMRNHTATHVLQAALRATLGPHVQQAGSVVSPDRLRFDFAHFQALTPEEIRKVEDWVNEAILADHPLEKIELSLDEARGRGAIAFFGEKYGARVRMVTIGNGLSKELCGGTHLERSATIGAFRITAESSIGSGVRRIEAVTGFGAAALARAQEDLLDDAARALKCPRADVPKKIRKVLEEQSKLKSRSGAAPAASTEDFAPRELGGEKIVSKHLPDASVDDLRKMMDTLIKKKNLAAAILAGGGEKPALVIGVREDLVKSKGLKAGDLAKEIGKACGGGGGGREFQAQAGASDPSKIPLAFETFESLVAQRLK